MVPKSLATKSVIRYALLLLIVAFGTFAGSARAGGRTPLDHMSLQGQSIEEVLSDGQFVYGPNALDFDMEAFLRSHDSPLIKHVQALQDWSMYASINPRVVLTLIEIRSGLVTGDSPRDLDDPIGYPGLDFSEEIEKLVVELGLDFYAHLYSYGSRSGRNEPSSQGAVALPLSDGSEIQVPSRIPSGTAAVLQRLADLPAQGDVHTLAVDSLAAEFLTTYAALFPEDDPLDSSNSINPSSPPPTTLFQFPFPLGSSWWFSGAHSWNGGGYGPPYSSMDFGTAGNTCESPPTHLWAVAAAWGVGYHPYGYSCWYRISHGNGWETSYYHLLRVRGDGGAARNDPIGTIGCETCAGGFATGPHVHFSLLYNGAYYDLQGTRLSGWRIDVGSGSYYDGYIERDGVRLYPYNTVFNDGIVGETICPRTGSIILYLNQGYDCGELGQGEGYFIPDASGWQNLPADFNDQASSINIPGGWSVRLYEHPFREGDSICISADVESFDGAFFEAGSVPLDDAISSLEVFENTECIQGNPDVVAIYEKPGQWGAQSAWQGEGLFNLPAYLDDMTSSIWIEDGRSAIVYSDVNGDGQTVCFDSSDGDFADNQFEDGQGVDGAVSSIAVIDLAVCPSKPGAPLLVLPEDGSGTVNSGSVTLSWVGDTGILDHYAEVQRVSGGGLNSGWISETSWDVGILEGGDYEWRVKSRDQYRQEGGWSAVWRFSIRRPLAVPADFDGDGSTDISIYRPSNGRWYIREGGSFTWGKNEDIPVPGDYDGDGSSEAAVYRPGNGRWYIMGIPSFPWGAPDDIPVPCDYDGDGDVDPTVFRPSEGRWYIFGRPSFAWGVDGDIPVPGDYDGDGVCEPAVFRSSNGRWYIQDTSDPYWGRVEDIPVPADYDGDGTTELAVYRPSNGRWYVYGDASISWGESSDIPVPGDYDGDGAHEVAVYRPAGGRWYVRGYPSLSWGLNGDFPLPVRDTNADGDPFN